MLPGNCTPARIYPYGSPLMTAYAIDGRRVPIPCMAASAKCTAQRGRVSGKIPVLLYAIACYRDPATWIWYSDSFPFFIPDQRLVQQVRLVDKVWLFLQADMDLLLTLSKRPDNVWEAGKTVRDRLSYEL